jgi:ABC-type transport system involved in multi-copper enzyme maturation permease subunit
VLAEPRRTPETIMSLPLFAVLILDREPLKYADVAGLAQAWLQDAGGFATLGLMLYLLTAMFASASTPISTRLRRPVTGFMVLMAIIAILLYAVYFALMLTNQGAIPANELPPPPQPGETIKFVPPRWHGQLQPMILAFAGLAGILGILQPFLRDVLKLKLRRILALAKVCFLEALRNRVFWFFLIYLIVFLFPAQWFRDIRPEDELRTPLGIFSVVKNLLLTIPFLILASFAIPNDLKYQTLYTIVTKPVERFEIVLGRFLGYAGLMTLALLMMVSASVVYIWTSQFDTRAKEESYRARVPVRGVLQFASRRGLGDGMNAGREFEYRKYIGGAPNSKERAVWSFESVPANLQSRDRDAVAIEYTFDIFRLTKGEENRGVDINIRVVSWQNPQYPSPVQGDGLWLWLDDAKSRDYESERQAMNDKLKTGGYGSGYETNLENAKPGTKTWELVDQLAKKYGIFEVPSVEVYDYRPMSVYVPVGLFDRAAEGDAKDKDGQPLPRFQIFIKCLSGGQMLGMAAADLYVIEGEKSFTENYFKAMFGLWCRLVIVIGVAVTCSTVLAAMINLIVTTFLYMSSFFAEHIQDVASGVSTGGGPFESLTRIFTNQAPTMPLEKTGGYVAFDFLDQVYMWLFRRYLNLIPDVEAFAWGDFLAEGYNVNFEYLVVNAIVLVGYLLPWGVLAYYLMKNREVAA